MIDEGLAYDANHPFHMHGYNFRVVAMQKVGGNVTVGQVKDMDANGTISRNLLDAPLKDTVTIPDGGYTILRFEADNPGFWLFHCHLEFHAEIGMALVFKVGENHQMPSVPPNFPKCGNYLPQVGLASIISFIINFGKSRLQRKSSRNAVVVFSTNWRFCWVKTVPVKGHILYKATS